jgi:hypothetical protein
MRQNAEDAASPRYPRGTVRGMGLSNPPVLALQEDQSQDRPSLPYNERRGMYPPWGLALASSVGRPSALTFEWRNLIRIDRVKQARR